MTKQTKLIKVGVTPLPTFKEIKAFLRQTEKGFRALLHPIETTRQPLEFWQSEEGKKLLSFREVAQDFDLHFGDFGYRAIVKAKPKLDPKSLAAYQVEEYKGSQKENDDDNE